MKLALLIATVLFMPARANAQVQTGTISGEIRTRDGLPASDIRVSAIAVPEPGVPANGTAVVSMAMTDTQGRYRLENVIAGRYYITAGFVDRPTYYPGVSTVGGATAVNVSSGSPLTGINFAVTTPVGVTVSGRVRKSTETGGDGGQRVVLIGNCLPNQEATTAADGSFQFLRILPGTYRFASSAGKTEQPFDVVVGEQAIAGLKIVVIPRTNDTGSIVVGDGTGLKLLGSDQCNPRVQSPLIMNYLRTSGTSSPSGSRSFSTQAEGSEVRLTPRYTVNSATNGTTDLMRANLRVTRKDSAELRVDLGTSSTTSAEGDVVGGTISSLSAPPPPPALPLPQQVVSSLSNDVKQISEAIAKPNLVTSVQPAYPPLANAARVQGDVVLEIEISTVGRVQKVTVLSGNPLLLDSAVEAARQWIYKPFVLDGQEIPVITTATLTFILP